MCLAWKVVLLRLLVVRVVAVVSMVTRSMVVVAGLLKHFMPPSEDVDHPKPLLSMQTLQSVTWRRNHYILTVLTVKLESYALDIWVSAKSLPFLLVCYVRSTNAMRIDVWRKFAVKNLMST